MSDISRPRGVRVSLMDDHMKSYRCVINHYSGLFSGQTDRFACKLMHIMSEGACSCIVFSTTAVTAKQFQAIRSEFPRGIAEFYRSERYNYI